MQGRLWLLSHEFPLPCVHSEWGISVSTKQIHCCSRMTEAINFRCSEHASSFDCPDMLVMYWEKFDEYGLVVHDGGTSVVTIQYCPWCGARLPESKRDRWFEAIGALGFDDPDAPDIPSEFQTSEWWMRL